MLLNWGIHCTRFCYSLFWEELTVVILPTFPLTLPPMLHSPLLFPRWLVETRRAPSRHSRDARVYDHTTTAMHKLSTPRPLPSCSPLLFFVLCLVGLFCLPVFPVSPLVSRFFSPFFLLFSTCFVLFCFVLFLFLFFVLSCLGKGSCKTWRRSAGTKKRTGRGRKTTRRSRR